jgi:ABC-type polysaccharide/polyol phosphate transport system ATPase subunit
MGGSVVTVPGAIAADEVSRRFRVHARETRTLKDLVVARGRTGGEDVWALRDISAGIAPGEAVGLVGRNGSGKSTLLRVLAGIIKPTTGTVEVGGRIGSLLELGAGFHPDFSGRENVYLNGSIQGLRRVEIRERFDEIVAFAEIEHAIDRPVRTYSSGMAMRLGFAIAAFLQADVLLLDEVFAVGDENFQRKCFGVIAAFKNQGGTILFVSHDAQAVERLCERSILLSHGEKVYDGPTHEAIARYRRLLADDLDPAERGAGLREWGSGEAEIAAVRLLDRAGETRQQFLAGEPLCLEVGLESHATLAPPRLHLELRDTTGLLVAEQAVDTATLGWPPGAGAITVRLDVDRPPFAFGRFRIRLGLVGADGRTLHQTDDAGSFLVYPDGEERGLVHLGGTWHGAANEDSR